MKNKRGDTYVSVCVFMLVIFMIFSAVFSFASAITLIKVQQSNTEIVFDSFIANNSILIYNNIKMGKNATDGVKTTDLTQSLVKFCSLTKSGARYYCYDGDGKETFNITSPVIGYLEEKQLELYVTYTMRVPIRFAGVTVATATIPVNISAELRSKN
ncbi:MAG: hypothetical protein IJK98_01295 [Clostridia bacterium]|nr:hypothetical protein [Clostridia bacterium]